MIPLKDDQRSSTRPIITYLILAVNVGVFIYEISLGPRLNTFIKVFGATPFNITHVPDITAYATLLSSMFVHANFMHIAGNMLFLWVFADNIEDRIGHIKFFFFYLITGIAGTLLHIVTATGSKIPMVGASGAISGILGAYVLLFPRARILALVPLGFFIRVMYLPSFIFLGIWFLYQFLLGITSLGVGSGVAYFAHIGGFVAGVLLALPFKFIRKNYEYQIS